MVRKLVNHRDNEIATLGSVNVPSLRVFLPLWLSNALDQDCVVALREVSLQAKDYERCTSHITSITKFHLPISN